MNKEVAASKLQSGLSRRTLLKSAVGGVAGAIGMPLVVRAETLGRNGGTAASNRIVLGHIGVGGQGMQHVTGGIWTQAGGTTGRDDVQVVAVCDVNAQRRDNARNAVNQRYGNSDCAVYPDFRELLERKDVDALLVATGERWHPFLAIAAARAGKDLYCEKPLSVTIEQALAAREAVERHGIVFQMGTQQRTSHAFAFACELVRNGYIGDVKEVIVGVGGPVTNRESHLPPQPVPEWLDYDMWLGAAPWSPYNAQLVGGWMAYRDFSGGEMTNWGQHHFDIAQWGLGMDNSGPVEIVPPDGKDVKVLTYHYASGAVMTRDPDRLARECGQGNGLMFVGTKGKVAVWRYDLMTWPGHLKHQKIGPEEIHLYRGDNHHTDFFTAVKTRGKTNVPIATGARSITVCHLGNIAYELGRPVKWDPTHEQFVNDPDATRLLSRRARAPWHL